MLWIRPNYKQYFRKIRSEKGVLFCIHLHTLKTVNCKNLIIYPSPAPLAFQGFYNTGLGTLGTSHYSVPDPNVEIRRAGAVRSSRPLDKQGGLQKENFRPFGPQCGLKIIGGGGAGPSIRHCYFYRRQKGNRTKKTSWLFYFPPTNCIYETF